ncbi:sodium-dependent neutral amino acid transporter B(0)AT2-like [Oncorhynchus tshawytscha]|uniref:sodium-dependent neutral amino acid transporter B(0)AT2-like n=1 Tax=Oncorhynchus tshawytscha TaxID=74940 RepID=UPI001C3C604F|nr:sodium-dependent neutral amino acid transporter B(0)AT2-like [Oncorhynchus tshawytscha]
MQVCETPGPHCFAPTLAWPRGYIVPSFSFTSTPVTSTPDSRLVYLTNVSLGEPIQRAEGIWSLCKYSLPYYISLCSLSFTLLLPLSLYSPPSLSLPLTDPPPHPSAVVDPECERSSATIYFWYRQTLNTTSTIADSGGLNVKMTLSLLVAWIIVCLAVIRGIASSGKAPTSPSVCYSVFKLEKMLEPQVWREAATQVFSALGLLRWSHHLLQLQQDRQQLPL